MSALFVQSSLEWRFSYCHNPQGKRIIKYHGGGKISDLSQLVLNADLTLQTHLKQIHSDGLEASCAHPISFTASFPSVFHVTAYSRAALLSSPPLVRFWLRFTPPSSLLLLIFHLNEWPPRISYCHCLEHLMT